MKKITLLLAAAAVIGVGSAFTTTQQSGETEYVLDPNTHEYILKSEATGACTPSTGEICTYVDRGSGFVPLNPGEDAVYVP